MHKNKIGMVVAALGLLWLTGCGGGSSGDKSATSSSSAASVNVFPTTFVVAGTAAEENVSNYQISVQGLNRKFSFYHPANPERKRLPLVIDFHGAGQDIAQQMITATDPWIAIARREGFYLLKPQALNDSYQTYTYWNVGWAIGRDDGYFIKTVLDSLIAQQDIDTDRIYVTGMSSGGQMAFYLAQTLQDQIAAVAPIAGSIMTSRLSNYTFKKPMPICHIHGDADTTVNIRGGDWYAPWSDILDLWLNNNKIDPLVEPTVIEMPDINTADNSTVTKFEYRGATIASDIDHYRINNGNHSIPGIETYANQDINSYEIIWEFFQKHKLSDPY